VQRREYLGACGLFAGGLAGCLGDRSTGSGGPNDTSTTDDATPTPGENELRTLDVAGSPGGVLPVVPNGEPALLDFWATWCAPCEPQMDELRAVRESFPDLHLLSITNESDTAAIRSFWREHEGTWPVAVDTELRTNQRFDVTRIPTLLVVDADGSVVWDHVGLAAAETISEALTEVDA